MNVIKRIIHYFFGKHRWYLKNRLYAEKLGEKIDIEYVFKCKKCPKEKHIYVYDNDKKC